MTAAINIIVTSKSNSETCLMPHITKNNNRYRDIVSMIKQVNSTVNSQKSDESPQKTTSKSVRLQMQFESPNSLTPTKVRVVRGTVAANRAFSRIIGASELFAPSPKTKKQLLEDGEDESTSSDFPI